MVDQEQQTLVVEEVELQEELLVDLEFLVQVDQESLLLATNFKINMYLLPFTINI